MEAIKRSIAPVHFDGHILDGNRPAKHCKIFTPGQDVNGVVRISTKDLPNAKAAWVEAVGQQVRVARARCEQLFKTLSSYSPLDDSIWR